MSNVHNLASDLPVLNRFDQFRKRATLVVDLRTDAIDIERSTLDQQRLWIRRHERISSLVASLTRDTAVLQRQATRAQIVEALLQFDDIPSGKTDQSGAKRLMAQRVAAQEPSFGGINLAVLRVIDQEDWRPAPAKVIKALAEAEAFLGGVSTALERLPIYSKTVTAALAESERYQASVSERQAKRIEHEQMQHEPPA